MVIVGIDLAGPSNIAETAAAWFSGNKNELSCMGCLNGANDMDLFKCVAHACKAEKVVVGIDAPLSYNPGGGDRPADSDLRRLLVEKGLRPGTVMAPTMTRMAYLTLRGVCVARALETIRPHGPRIVEVHPAGALILHGAPAASVRQLKNQRAARARILEWLESQGLTGAKYMQDTGDDLVAAWMAAYAAWKWALGDSVWCERAQPPLHPYDFAC